MQVLIAEDDAALGAFLQKGLKLEGHEVTWVGDGAAALEQTRGGLLGGGPNDSDWDASG